MVRRGLTGGMTAGIHEARERSSIEDKNAATPARNKTVYKISITQ